jgi:DNA-binding FadR family transcriptional regulator
VSVSTVVEAYERLAAEGLISARAGSGFYVSGPATAGAGRDGARLDRAVDPLWVSAIAGNARGPPQAGLRLDAQ